MAFTVDQAEIDRRFDKLSLAFGDGYGDVSFTLKGAATVLALQLPEGREKSLALTALEEALHWAAAAITRN